MGVTKYIFGQGQSRGVCFVELKGMAWAGSSELQNPFSFWFFTLTDSYSGCQDIMERLTQPPSQLK